MQNNRAKGTQVAQNILKRDGLVSIDNPNIAFNYSSEIKWCP